MSFQQRCIVYPTSRNIRFALAEEREGFLPHYLSMGDLLNRLLVSDHRIVPDDDLRLLAMHEACRFEGFSQLNIERNFFTFIQNSQYIFRFFEELGAEMVDIDSLELADIYGEYEEHIAILKQIRNNYRLICDEKGWIDPIFRSITAKINREFLAAYDSVQIHIEGYLTRFELNLLIECADIIPLECVYTATPFNRKMSSRFEEVGISMEEGKQYRFSLSERSVVSAEPMERNRTMTCESFHSRMAQVGFVKAKIAQMVQKGISPENIAVVLPDESFATYLKLFDDENNFNFAMGESLTQDNAIREIEAIALFMDEPSAQNRARIEKIDSEWIGWIKHHYHVPFEPAQIQRLAERMIEGAGSAEVGGQIEEELYRFAPLYPALASMEFKSVLRIFINRLKKRTTDDVRGGKITVMGVLETRGVSYEGVVVVDFNESVVPHRSQKDLFLNTQTRNSAGLPTALDRESLQKHYYTMLFNRAKSVAIGCVQNSESTPSRFLIQLGIAISSAKSEYERILLSPCVYRDRSIPVLRGEYDFRAYPLSASRLKSFLGCRREFYYRYVAKIPDHQMPKDMSEERDIGNAIHQALETLYRENKGYENPIQIKDALQKLWEAKESADPLERYMHSLWLEKLGPFYQQESERYRSGCMVAYREKECEAVVEGIRLNGRIDRIDETPEGLEVIDYKTGKYPSVENEPKEGDIDYQLSIYALIAAQLGKISGCAYYDLNTGELKFEQFLEAKIEALKTILRELGGQQEWEWSLCDDISRCRYCSYAHLCAREL